MANVEYKIGESYLKITVTAKIEERLSNALNRRNILCGEDFFIIPKDDYSKLIKAKSGENNWILARQEGLEISRVDDCTLYEDKESFFIKTK